MPERSDSTSAPKLSEMFVTNADSYWKSSTSATTLTSEMIRKATEKIKEDESLPCSHVVGPYDKGWTMCAQCFGPVYVDKPRLER